MDSVPLDLIYTCVNRAILAACQSIGTEPVVFGQPQGSGGQPASSYRVWWLDYGRASGAETVAKCQIDIFQGPTDSPAGLGVPSPATMLRRAMALDKALGLNPDSTRIATADLLNPAGTKIGTVQLGQIETGWINLPDTKPGMLHIAKTLIVRHLAGGLVT